MKSKKYVITETNIQDAERLKAIFEKRKKEAKAKGIKFNQSIFGEKYGWSQGAVGQYLNATIPLNLSAALKFAEGLNVKLGEISPSLDEYLNYYQLQPKEMPEDLKRHHDEGSKALVESIDQGHYYDEPARDVIQRLMTGGDDNSPLISIPYLDARAACGPGAFNADTPDILGRYEISEDFLIRLGLPSDGRGLILIDSNGDSMAPSIPSDTPLLINTLEKCFNTLVNGKVYVFCANGAIICKRIYRNLDGTIKLHSDNSNKDLYPDQDVSEDLFNTFEVIGRLKFAFVEF